MGPSRGFGGLQSVGGLPVSKQLMIGLMGHGGLDHEKSLVVLNEVLLGFDRWVEWKAANRFTGRGHKKDK